MGLDVAAMTEPDTWLPTGWRSTRLGGLLRTARPKQWLKNVLVFAAPGAAGVLTHGHAIVDGVVAFTAFCLVASGVYFVNDTQDVDADRRHPRKRLRPVPAGVISVGLARVVGAVLVASGLALSVAASAKFLLVLAIYVAIQMAYSFWLKDEPIVDLTVVAAGFVLRAIGGAVAVGVPISQWFLIVATFGSLFMVTGKRIADLITLDARQLAGRPAHATYSTVYLQSVLVMSATVTITAYCLWAFENVKAVHGTSHAAIGFQLSIVPFTVALMRYGFLIDQGRGGAPEDLVLGDRMLLALAFVWAVLFTLGVYL